MYKRLKQYVLIALAGGAFYYLLSHHFIFLSLTEFETLIKTQLTLRTSFYSLYQHAPEETLRNNRLRDAGIGELMVEKGMLTKEKLHAILAKIDEQQ
ncbi:MAG: hypothetical protein GY874_04070 [Desulfobacteraceae bacterium]|nr:hypothetical protein [Desulfobacteraceae bacterium]